MKVAGSGCWKSGGQALGGRHSTSEAPLSPSLTPWEPQWEGRGEGSWLGQSQAVHPNPHCTPQKSSLLLWLNLLWARDAP